jgi:hypothetical protein
MLPGVTPPVKLSSLSGPALAGRGDKNLTLSIPVLPGHKIFLKKGVGN